MVSIILKCILAITFSFACIVCFYYLFSLFSPSLFNRLHLHTPTRINIPNSTPVQINYNTNLQLQTHLTPQQLNGNNHSPDNRLIIQNRNQNTPLQIFRRPPIIAINNNSPLRTVINSPINASQLQFKKRLNFDTNTSTTVNVNTSTTVTVNNAFEKVCKSCGLTGHLTDRSKQCLQSRYEYTNKEVSNKKCSSCGLIGHLTIKSKDCLNNKNKVNDAKT